MHRLLNATFLAVAGISTYAKQPVSMVFPIFRRSCIHVLNKTLLSKSYFTHNFCFTTAAHFVAEHVIMSTYISWASIKNIYGHYHQQIKRLETKGLTML